MLCDVDLHLNKSCVLCLSPLKILFVENVWEKQLLKCEIGEIDISVTGEGLIFEAEVLQKWNSKY